MNSSRTRTLISTGLVVALVLVFSLTATKFFTWSNVTLIFKDAAYTGILALGVAFTIIGGGIDLSVGGIVCVVAIITARAASSGVPGILCILIAIAAGGLCGALNGLIITKLHVSEFVTTLADGFIFFGLGIVFSFRDDGRIITKYIKNPGFFTIGQTAGNSGIYYITIVFIVAAILLYILQTRFRFGLYTYAIGSNNKSAMMSGVNNDMIKFIGFVISGVCAGLTSGLVCANQSSANAGMGKNMEFMAIAACVVGGVALGGGRGNAINAFLGALFMTIIMNGLLKYGLSTAWQFIFQCIIIILATVFDALFIRMNDRRLRTLAES